MNDTKKIFKVKMDKIEAELEIHNNSLKCVTGDTVHFDTSFSDIRAFEFQKPSKIIMNIYKASKIYLVELTSKYAIDIHEELQKCCTTA